MTVRHSFIQILAGLVALPLVGAVASAATIEVLEVFDVPGAGKQTLPQKINDGGVVVGTVIDAASGAARGFYRQRNGQFSAPYVEPNDTANLTQGRGINNDRVLCGEYDNGSDGTFHGYFIMNRAFSEFDVPDAADTIPLGINNAGDFVGSFIPSDGGVQQGFVSLGGAVTAFAIPDATATLAYQLNASNQLAGYYVDVNGATHGYLRASDGTLTFPIDPAGSVGTILFGTNDANWVVGRYADAAGITHGLFFMTPDDFLTFDYPGSAFTSLNGINQEGIICGRYVDDVGGVHGFLAKVHPNDTSEPKKTNNLPLLPVKPRQPAPMTPGTVAPAL